MNAGDLQNLLLRIKHAWSELQPPSIIIDYNGDDEIEVRDALIGKNLFEIHFGEFPFEMLSIYTTLNSRGKVYYTGGIIFQSVNLAIEAPCCLDAFFAFLTLQQAMLLYASGSGRFIRELLLYPECVAVMCDFAKVVFAARGNADGDVASLKLSQLWQTPNTLTALKNQVPD